VVAALVGLTLQITGHVLYLLKFFVEDNLKGKVSWYAASFLLRLHAAAGSLEPAT
jgi:hypothetical protein